MAQNEKINNKIESAKLNHSRTIQESGNSTEVQSKLGIGLLHSPSKLTQVCRIVTEVAAVQKNSAETPTWLAEHSLVQTKASITSLGNRTREKARSKPTHPRPPSPSTLPYISSPLPHALVAHYRDVK